MGLYDEDMPIGEDRIPSEDPIFVEPEPIDYSGYANLTGPELAKFIKDVENREAFAGMGAGDIASFLKRVASGAGTASDYAKLATIGGGLLAASRPSQSTGPTGFQGKIPKYTATRNMLTAPPVGRRPGSGGIDYGGGTSYFDKAGKLVSSNERSMEELRQAAITNPFNRAATYEGQTGLGQTDLAKFLAELNKGQTPAAPTTPTTPTTPVVGGGVGGGTTPTVGGGGGLGTSTTRPAAATGTPAESAALRTQLRTEFEKGPKTQDALDALLLKYPPSVMQAEFPEFGNVANYNNATMEAYYRQERQAREANRAAMRASGQEVSVANPGGDVQISSPSAPKMSAIPQWELDAARAKLSPEQAALIDWRLAQVNPMTGQRVADEYARQGTNPYASGAQAQEQLDRTGGKKAWEDPDWRTKQQAAEDAERARADKQRADWMAIPEAQRTVAGPGGATAPTAGYGNYLDKPMYTPPTAKGGIMDWYNANVGRTDDRAQGDLSSFLANSGYTAKDIATALPQWGEADLQTAINAARGAPELAPAAAPQKDTTIYEEQPYKKPEPVPVASVASSPFVAGPVAPTPAPAPVVNRGYDEEVPREEIPGMYGFAEGGLASNGFVVPADVVSHFGNGSSEAGLKLLASKLGAKPIKGDGDGMSDSIPTSIDGKQEARVANDEAFISPAMVKRLGGGDEEKGAKKLYAMMDKIRKARTGSEEQGKQINPDKFMPGGSVKNYATGGTTTLPSTATGSESSLSNWSGEYVTDMLGRGSALAQAPYQAYTGPLTAGASQLQQQAFAGAGGLQTPGSIGQAAGTAGGIANLAANMRYTPQTTDFFGNANVSGLGVAPSYGMGMPQQPAQMGTPSNPIPMPRGNVGQFGGKTPAPLPQGEELYFPTGADEFGGEPITISGRPQRIKQPPMPMGDQLSYTGGSQDFDETTGTYRSEDGRGMLPSQDGMIQNRMMNRGPAEQPMQGAGLPGLMQTQQPQASQPVGNVAQQYMNPYLESALRPQMAEMQRAADIARLSDAARLTQAGAYGGSRQAIMESEGRRNLLGKQTEALGQGYATAYDKAMQQFNADQARRAQEAQFGATFGLQGAQTGIQGAQAQGQLGALQSQSDINNLRAQMEAGGVQRGIESEGIAADKAQFEEARLNPYKMIQFEQSLLSGLPLAAQSYTMPGQSNLQQFAGGATTLTQLLKNLGYKLD